MTTTATARAATPRGNPAPRVILSGAIGGLVYWAGLRVLGVRPFDLPWYAAVPASLLFGAVAGFLGVYWIANSDTSDASKLMRTFAFAVICGICWSPIIQAAKQDVNNVLGARDAQTAQKQVDSLQKLKGGSSGEVTQAISTSVESTTQAIQKLPDIHNEEVRQDIQNASQATTKALVETARDNPDASIQGLEKLGKTAAANKNITLVKSVADSLSEVERSNPNLAIKTSAARRSVINAAGLPAPPTGLTVLAR